MLHLGMAKAAKPKVDRQTVQTVQRGRGIFRGRQAKIMAVVDPDPLPLEAMAEADDEGEGEGEAVESDPAVEPEPVEPGVEDDSAVCETVEATPPEACVTTPAPTRSSRGGGEGSGGGDPSGPNPGRPGGDPRPALPVPAAAKVLRAAVVRREKVALDNSEFLRRRRG